MNKLDFEDPFFTLNGMTTEVPSPEMKALLTRVRAWCKDRPINIVLTTNPLVSKPLRDEDGLHIPIIEDLEPKVADFIFNYAELHNDIDGDYGMICVKSRVPQTKDWKVVDNTRFSPNVGATVLTFIPPGEEGGEPRTTIQFWEKPDE